ncbi:hypothetical protein M011DRAFT_329603 [Sporormia fimetaria CBS 119925]|uniref:Uncharacterized protein n=1 Tax=Sporormia fimetaria CBS 119925 TaxID=1340428 RepID=A0A6A6VJ41_9PLEO|nr:hypothetical protein M011DRAFT_329603 [Sporormia fimetaria CBS 119925]
MILHSRCTRNPHPHSHMYDIAPHRGNSKASDAWICSETRAMHQMGLQPFRRTGNRDQLPESPGAICTLQRRASRPAASKCAGRVATICMSRRPCNFPSFHGLQVASLLTCVVLVSRQVAVLLASSSFRISGTNIVGLVPDPIPYGAFQYHALV